MRRLFTISISLLFVLSLTAQTRKPVAQKKPATTATKKTTTANKGKATQTKGKTTQAKGKTTQAKTKATPVKGKAAYTTAEIKGLQSQRAKIQQKIKEQERLLQANKADVKKRMDNLFVINSEIEQHQRSIDGIQKDIQGIDGNIDLLKAQLATLEQQLVERKEKYVKSMRYMARHRNIQDQMMFVFSAKNFAQMYRRIRFVRDYAAYQRAQGEQVKQKQEQIAAKYQELEKLRSEKNSLLHKGKQEQAALQGKQQEQQQVVTTLQKQQKTIQGIIDEQRKKDQELNAQIDRLVEEEMAKARIRAAEEARKREAEARKKREEELARKKAAAEKAERENARRIAEAKERERKLREQARTSKSPEEKARVEKDALQAQADREAIERKAEVENRRHRKEIDDVKKEDSEARAMNSVDRKLSSNFANNKGRLPMPMAGRIVRHFGQYSVEGLRGVTLDSKGINIKGSAGAQVRCIFNGEVSRVFGFNNTWVVMVRHGGYISVYCNLGSVSVRTGQQVSTRQALGTVGSDQTLQFQLYHQKTKLNPEAWLGR